jgi:hypothetical protein
LDFHGFSITNPAFGDLWLTETTWHTKAVELLMPLQLLLQARSVMSSESRLSPWVCYKGHLKQKSPRQSGARYVCWLIDPMTHINYYSYKLFIRIRKAKLLEL